jgi:hypothetical protein
MTENTDNREYDAHEIHELLVNRFSPYELGRIPETKSVFAPAFSTLPPNASHEDTVYTLVDYAMKKRELKQLHEWITERLPQHDLNGPSLEGEAAASPDSQPDDSWSLLQIGVAVAALIFGCLVGAFLVRPGSDQVKRLELPFEPASTASSAAMPTWQTYPEDRNYVLQLSDHPERVGSSALKLTVSMDTYQYPTADQEYAGIGVTLDDYSLLEGGEVVACSAYVYVKELQPGSAMRAKAYAYTNDVQGYYMAFISPEIPLTAGDWTKVTASIGYALDYGHPDDQAPQFSLASSDRRLNTLYINVFDDQLPYTGDIYFDEVVCYVDPPNPTPPPQGP